MYHAKNTSMAHTYTCACAFVCVSTAITLPRVSLAAHTSGTVRTWHIAVVDYLSTSQNGKYQSSNCRHGRRSMWPPHWAPAILIDWPICIS